MTDDMYWYSKDNPHRICGVDGDYVRRKTAFIIPSHVKIIGNLAFKDCAATIIVFPEGVEEIGEEAFIGCTNLKAVYIPDSVERIGCYAFCASNDLTIYCEGEPKEGWIAEDPRYEEQEVYTDADYAFDFHRGGVNKSCVRVDVSKHWNRDHRPVVTNFPLEKFMAKFKELLGNDK